MKGHEGIIKLRLAGKAPELVLLDDLSHPSPFTDWEGYDSMPVVCVHKDPIEGLDLRFLVGCKVSVTSHSEDRAKRLFNACKRAGAKTVASAHSFIDGEVSKTGWVEVWHG